MSTLASAAGPYLESLPRFGSLSRRIDASTSRTLLLLLYATGLRISEALNLNLADVDLDDRVLHVGGSKLYKTRLVPIGTDLTQVLREYAQRRYKRSPLDSDAPFLLTSRGERVSRAGAEQAFSRDAIAGQGLST